jgi:hypothetical protein
MEKGAKTSGYRTKVLLFTTGKSFKKFLAEHRDQKLLEVACRIGKISAIDPLLRLQCRLKQVMGITARA